MGSASSSPSEPRVQEPPVENTASFCPIPEQFRNPAIYNVYNERIDGYPEMNPKNNMPMDANQTPSPGQRKLLATEREISNIPKGGTTGSWVYPSPQMFFNGKDRWLN